MTEKLGVVLLESHPGSGTDSRNNEIFHNMKGRRALSASLSCIEVVRNICFTWRCVQKCGTLQTNFTETRDDVTGKIKNVRVVCHYRALMQGEGSVWHSSSTANKGTALLCMVYTTSTEKKCTDMGGIRILIIL